MSISLWKSLEISDTLMKSKNLMYKLPFRENPSASREYIKHFVKCFFKNYLRVQYKIYIHIEPTSYTTH